MANVLMQQPNLLVCGNPRYKIKMELQCAHATQAGCHYIRFSLPTKLVTCNHPFSLYSSLVDYRGLIIHYL